MVVCLCKCQVPWACVACQLVQLPAIEFPAVLAAGGAQAERARDLARRLQVPLLAPGADPSTLPRGEVVLLVVRDGLSLQLTGVGAPGPVRVDFDGGGMRYRRRTGGAHLLRKAVGWGKKPDLRVLDATAGLGRDAFLLADIGCQVILCEREPLLGALLQDALESALRSAEPMLQAIVQRLQLCVRDATSLCASQLGGMDVIYLDPMFPPRAKSAAVKKEMALFQSLFQHDSPGDADTLLSWALQQDVARIVVKRPLRAPDLGAISPSHRIAGKTVRFDVYVRRKLQ